MIPLIVFLLACAGVYLGCIGSAFSVLMRLSLRLVAERSDRPGTLGAYLDDPILLFAPVRLLLGLVTVAATTLLAVAIGLDSLHRMLIAAASAAAFVAICELLLPLLIVSRDPERVLELLLPTFSPIARVVSPITQWTTRFIAAGKRQPPATEESSVATTDAPNAYIDDAAQKRIIQASSEHRGLRRCPGTRNHDPASRHCRHS